MKVSMVDTTEVIEYDDMNDFYRYICDTPINEAFRWEDHSSVSEGYEFTRTRNFEEAVMLMENGWEDMSKKLNTTLRAKENELQPVYKKRPSLNVCGYQAVVPLYLQGIPTNMIDKKNVVIKQKVITINKSIDYHAGIGQQQIVDESIKALQIVKKLESKGYRINLNIVLGTTKNLKSFIVSVRIKSAGERLNISKLAFPLVHPSMLRRLMFRFIEVYPKITKDFVYGYGRPSRSSELKDVISKMGKDEYLIPSIFTKDLNDINDITDL